jgi:hypothetical protein
MRCVALACIEHTSVIQVVDREVLWGSCESGAERKAQELREARARDAEGHPDPQRGEGWAVRVHLEPVHPQLESNLVLTEPLDPSDILASKVCFHMHQLVPLYSLDLLFANYNDQFKVGLYK